MEQFTSLLSSTIDSTLGLRCKLYGYQYSEIIRSLLCVYFCGGSCVEDVTAHLMSHLSLHPTLRTCSADTILRAINELTRENISYTSDAGKSYDFNTADTLNTLLLNCLLSTGQLKNPWICPAWRSTVTTRFAPAVDRKSATSLALMGARGLTLRS